MGIYYLDANVIGRSSGRSAVGAAAYRRSAKMKSIAHAAYQRGEKIIGEGDSVTHDYRAKGGVVYSEIMLPENAPPEFMDAQTLWNAVEVRETHKKARLAREVIVALPRDFCLAEQTDVLRAYVKENFVSKGLGVDFSIHDKGDGNPHAHIMFTTRFITPEGLGKKDRDLDKKSELMKWRKGWTDVNNRMFERLGLDERIDHRSYKEQGLDREPMIHLGHKASALEKKGIKTERGDYNREIQRRNAERETREIAFESSESEDNKDSSVLKKERDEGRDTAKTLRHVGKLQRQSDAERTARKDARQSEVEKAARRVEKSWEDRRAQNLKELEEYLKAAKAEKIAEEMRERQNIAENMHETRENYIALEKELNRLKYEYNTENQELPPLRYRTQKAGEYVKNIAELKSEGAKLQKMRQSLSWRDWGRKAEIDEKIRQVEQKIAQEQDSLKNRFHIDPAHAHAELKRLQEEIREKEHKANIRAARIQEIKGNQEAIKLAYHTQKLLNETRHDRQKIDKLLEEMNTPPESIREKSLQERAAHRLNTVTDEDFQRVIKNLPKSQAENLIKHVESKKLGEARRLLRDITEKERSRTDDRGR